MASSSNYDHFSKVRSTTKCNDCSGALTPIESKDDGVHPIAFWCGECEKLYGVDDLFSEEQCQQATDVLQAAVEDGRLRATVCRNCGNDDINKFKFDQDDNELSLRCMSCNCATIIEDTNDVTKDTEDIPSVDEFPYVCRCGNDNPDFFDVHSSTDGRVTIFQCHACDNEIPAFVNKGEDSFDDTGAKDGSFKKNYLKIRLLGTTLSGICGDIGKNTKEMLSDGKLRNKYLRLAIVMAASSVGPPLGHMLIPVDGVIGKTMADMIGRGIGKFIGWRCADFLGFK